MKRFTERLVVLTVFGVLALNHPLLSLFSRETFLLGIPVLFLYIFLFWLFFIIMIALISKRTHTEDNQ
ncbi:MAG: hypothetical protein HQL65_13940 [Magnetococcales bacterium]|nr:hypothetical protein [Magnetococcales bacterium]